jgi:hypothetical protein
VEPAGRHNRRGPCPCGSRIPLGVCCLPREEAFQRLAARLVRYAEGPALAGHQSRGAAIFWNLEPPRRPATHGGFGGRLHFLEWLLHEYRPAGQGWPALARFADGSADLTPPEEALLLGLLLAPTRLYEVAESRGWRGYVLRDVLAGVEQTIGPLALRVPPIRGDLLITRVLGGGRLGRPGLSALLLPGGAREELLAYLRAAFRLTQTGRHVSFEDFLDRSTYLYHHFHLLRGRPLGGRLLETVRPFAYAPAVLLYRGSDMARMRAVLDRQPDLEPEAGTPGERTYAWIERSSGCLRGSLRLSPAGLLVCADTAEDAAEVRRLAEEWLRGLLAGSAEERSPEGGGPGGAREPAGPGPAGGRFLRRALDRWAGMPHPALGERTPLAACASRAGRQRVEALLGLLERDLARSKRQGGAWAETGPVREALGLGPSSPPRAVAERLGSRPRHSATKAPERQQGRGR